jgi:hypothetical protein
MIWIRNNLLVSEGRPSVRALAQALPVLPRVGVLGLWLAAACGGEDPILSRARDLDTKSVDGAAGGSGGGAAGGSPGQPAGVGQPAPPPFGSPSAPPLAEGGQPPPGRPEQPAPGVPTGPPPGGAVGDPGGGAGIPADAPMVAIQGTLTVEGWGGGPIRIDVFDGDQREIGGKRPSVVGMARLDKPGPYSVQVPAASPKVWVGAFADENKDGRPGPSDPAVWYPGNPVNTAGDRDHIDLVLKKDDRPPPGKTELQ